ncbi:hypothetical protein ES703_58341 [subsurface metagenome]
MRKFKVTPLILAVLLVASTGIVIGALVWNKNLGGNLQVLMAEYQAELFEDPECTVVATSVSVSPAEQGQTAKSETLYLKITGSGRMYFFYNFQWLSACLVQASAEYSWDGTSWVDWPEGLLNFIDMSSDEVVQVRWIFNIPSIAGVKVSEYQITLKGESIMPSG